MRHEIKKLPQSKIELEVELEADEMRPYLSRAAEELSTERPIEGFRPGKAPYDIAAKHFGEMKLYERALNDAINRIVPKLLDEGGIQIVGRPEVSVKKIAPGNPVVFSVISAVIPEFTLPDFESIAKKALKERKTSEVMPNELNEALAWLQNAKAEVKKVERPAQKGDPVEIDFTAAHEGKTLAGGTSKNHPLVIGEGTMVPGFEDELVGMSAGEEKKFSLIVPEDHREPTIAGKTLDFDVKMALVQERALPEVNDEFARSAGNFEGLTALKANITAGLLEEKEIKERDRIRVAMMDAIADKTDIAVPEVMIEREVEKMLAELRDNLASMNLKYEDYLTHLKKTEEDLAREWQEDAKRRVKIGLILRAIAKAKNIEPDEAETAEEVTKLLARFKSAEEASARIDPAALESYARGIVRNEKVFRYLEELGE